MEEREKDYDCFCIRKLQVIELFSKFLSLFITNVRREVIISQHIQRLQHIRNFDDFYMIFFFLIEGNREVAMSWIVLKM